MKNHVHPVNPVKCMPDYILKHRDMPALIARLGQHATIYAPVENDGVVTFAPIETADRIACAYQNSDVPPKQILFPQTETLFCYALGSNRVIAVPEQVGQTIIFGIRPCDAKSLLILDKVFEGATADVYYVQKRRNIVLIGLSCGRPGVNCFCTSLQGSPMSTDGLDLLFTNLGEAYVVEVCSATGALLAEKISDVLHPLSETQCEQRTAIQKQAEQQIKREIAVEGVTERLDTLFYHELWCELSRNCVGCSICTFLCPTCHCFDICDETFATKGIRVRVWDTCSNPEYTRQASGHNPRPGRLHRMRNRIYHKYNYFPHNSGVIACVGCGRCISKCPVNIDILEILRRIQE